MPANSASADAGAPHHEADAVDVAVGDAREEAVERLEEAPGLLVLVLQDQHAQRSA